MTMTIHDYNLLFEMRMFDFSHRGLTSLEGISTNACQYDFHCDNNQLTSLEGAPSSVGINFYCSDNQLTSLEGAPSSVGGDFDCTSNPNLPYSELFKIVDNIKGNIYYNDFMVEDIDKDKIRRDRNVKNILKSDELGNLDV